MNIFFFFLNFCPFYTTLYPKQRPHSRTLLLSSHSFYLVLFTTSRARLRTISIYTRSINSRRPYTPSGYTLRLRLYTP